MVNDFSQEAERIERLLAQGWRRFADDDHAAALREAETVLWLDEENATANALAAASLVRLGRHAEAEAPARRAAQLAPEAALARLILAEALAATGRLDEAESTLWEAIALEPFNAETHLKLGRFLLRRDRPLAARERLERATELAPGRAEPHLLLSHAYGQLNDIDRADAMIEKAYQLAPEDDRVLAYRGTLALMRAHEKLARTRRLRDLPAASAALQRAVAMLRRAVEINPRNGYADDALKSAEEALRHVEKALKKRTAGWHPRFGAGWLALYAAVLGGLDALSDGARGLWAYIAPPVVACLLWLAGRGLWRWRRASRRQEEDRARPAPSAERAAARPADSPVVEPPPERRTARRDGSESAHIH